MSNEKATSVNILEQFVLLAKSTKGMATVELTKQVLEAPGLYVFGELLDMPNIQQMAEGPGAPYLELLNIFAYGTYKDYKEKQSSLPSLTPAQEKKLQHLTIVSLAVKNKCIPYSLLTEELDIKNLRELEDIIIEAVYAEIIQGKLDQERQLLEVDYAIGRDIQAKDITQTAHVLQAWCNSCESLLQNIETEMLKANQNKAEESKRRQQTETEIQNIKKSLKTHDMDEHMSIDCAISTTATVSMSNTKKPSKPKGPRTGAKFWNNK